MTGPAPGLPPAPSVRVHATSLAIGRHGVLIRGPSGIGKSRLARDLLDRAGVLSFRALIADDQTDLHKAHGAVIANCPPTIAGRIEWRGLGIVDMPRIAAARIDLVIDLVAPPDSPRLPPDDRMLTDILGIGLPHLVLAADGGAATTVERALALG